MFVWFSFLIQGLSNLCVLRLFLIGSINWSTKRMFYFPVSACLLSKFQSFIFHWFAERKGRLFVARSDRRLSSGLNGRGGRAEQLITNAVAVSILYSLIIIVTHMIDYLLVEMCLN